MAVSTVALRPARMLFNPESAAVAAGRSEAVRNALNAFRRLSLISGRAEAVRSACARRFRFLYLARKSGTMPPTALSTCSSALSRFPQQPATHTDGGDWAKAPDPATGARPASDAESTNPWR